MLKRFFSRALMLLAALAVTGFSFFSVSASAYARASSGSDSAYGTVLAQDLPRDAQITLARIKAGGPFPFAKDGTTFGNYERQLPKKPRGYYTEYTVARTADQRRGARRIVAGKGATGSPATSGEYWYTPDHYRTFKKILEKR